MSRLTKCITVVIAAAFSIAPVTAAQASEIPKHLKPQWERVRKLHENMLKKAENRLAGIKVQIKDKNVRKDKKKYGSLKKEQRTLELNIRAMKKGSAPYIVELKPDELKPGQIGYFKTGRFEVEQVFGKDAVLITPMIRKSRITFHGLESSQSFWSERGNPFLIRECPTTELTDGADVTLADIYEVVGTERVPTGETVMRLNYYSIEAMKLYLIELKRKKK